MISIIKSIWEASWRDLNTISSDRLIESTVTRRATLQSSCRHFQARCGSRASRAVTITVCAHCHFRPIVRATITRSILMSLFHLATMLNLRGPSIPLRTSRAQTTRASPIAISWTLVKQHMKMAGPVMWLWTRNRNPSTAATLPSKTVPITQSQDLRSTWILTQTVMMPSSCPSNSKEMDANVKLNVIRCAQWLQRTRLRLIIWSRTTRMPTTRSLRAKNNLKISVHSTSQRKNFKAREIAWQLNWVVTARNLNWLSWRQCVSTINVFFAVLIERLRIKTTFPWPPSLSLIAETNFCRSISTEISMLLQLQILFLSAHKSKNKIRSRRWRE